jgi:hypothetical protein
MDTNTIQFQALITFVMPFLIQLAKRSQNAAFRWIDQNKPKVCVVASAATSILTSMGIAIEAAPHRLTLTWPDESTLLHGLATLLLSSVVQFASQHALYEGFWRILVPASPAPHAALRTQPQREQG